MAKSNARPFIKWAGGKTQLLGAIRELLPRKMGRYFEPFIGGGANFWALASEGCFERAVINDWNPELVNVYDVVRATPDKLIDALSAIKRQEWNTEAYFLAMRAKVPATLAPIERAARFIYLNKTCFNGLHRVNKSGQFNVPFGRYKNPGLFETENLMACSAALNKKVEVQCGDFSQILLLKEAGPGDVVYFDPPYVPLSASSDFASYTSAGFDMKDQQRLAMCFRDLAKRGVSCVLSNSDMPVVRQLYEGFDIVSVQAKRNINSKAEGRGPVGEVLVVHRGTEGAWTAPVTAQVADDALDAVFANIDMSELENC